MPRSYRFDHFTTHKPQPGPLSEPDAPKKLVEMRAPRGTDAGKFHYGKRYQQTEERFQLHRAEAQARAQDIAPLPMVRGKTKAKKKPKHVPAALPPTPSPEGARGAPIGALPASPEAHPPDRVTELLGDALRYARTFWGAAHDLTSTGARLLLFPLDVTRIIARRLAALLA
jgi:hypothetical protein